MSWRNSPIVVYGIPVGFNEWNSRQERIAEFEQLACLLGYRIEINKWYQSFALRNFDLEDMKFEYANSSTTIKLPILKLVSVPQIAQENGTLITKMHVLVTAKEKTNKKNDVNARSLLLMALPNEHQLIFSQYCDAKSMLQKIVSRLAILGVVIAQEDLNSKFLSSLPPEWNTHVVIWMIKPEVDTMSIDDLYNNFKIVEQKVKKSVGASSGAQNLAFMTAPSTSSTNDVNTASPQVSTTSLSDNTMYAFMVENPNGSNLLHQDLEQICEDDLEAMDLKWQLSLLSMRAKRECRAPKSKEGQFRNQDNTRKQGSNEDTSSKAMLAIDGVGFDWSDMAEEQVQTNMALMAFSDSEVYNDKTCSKTCLKNYETLKKQCDDLIVKLNQTEFIATTYKRGLATLEEQLIIYRKNEVLFSEEVAVLKREVACKDYEIKVLKNQLLGSQITNKSKKGLGYSAVPPPYPLIFNRPNKLDLSYSGLDEFKEPEFKGYGTKNSKQESNIVCDKKTDDSKKSSDDSLVKKQVSKDTSSFVESSPNVDKETIFPVDKKVESVKPKNHEKPVKKSARYAEMYRLQTLRGNQRNWNGQKSNQLGSDFVMYKKACFICGSFNHVQAQCKYHQKEGMVYGNTYKRVNYNYSTKRTHPNDKRNMVPKAVLLKTGLTPLNTIRPVNTTHSKPAVHINTAKAQAVNTARPKVVKTARLNSAVVNAVRVKGENASKPQQDDTGFVDSGCSRHMTGNIAFLSDFKEFDGGYVAFGGGAYGGRITSKGTLKTDNLDFKDVYFVNELKFNLFSISQMCDKKNYVLFTDTECLVLSPNFKLPDENQILLKIPRKDNMKQQQSSFISQSSDPIDEARVMLTYMDLFGPTFDETSEILKNFIKEIENLVDKKVKIIRTDNGTKFKNKVMDDFCREKGIKREYSVARTPQQNSVAERRNRTLIEAARTMLANSKLPTTFWADAVSTACYVQNRVLVVKPHNKILYELFRGFKPALSFMRPFGCHVTILNTLDSLGMFDGKSDKGTQGEISIGTSEAIRQDCIVMPIWKDASYFDSPSKDDNGEPKSAADDQKQDGDGPNNENVEKDKFEDDSSTKEVNAVGQHINTVNPDVNTGSSKLNTVDPSVNTASSHDQDSPKDMFTMGASHTLEATHVEFFSEEEEL
ncbi:putative ribonuclease H-like domain-containing protein [Tanacetum coccineum]|uniref:Ribonuclease H-like domain-containing protein n=1 Tax=Tanacetum coccineum TaxID=301880 RepID=A0ABQ5GR79_9ASTR